MKSKVTVTSRTWQEIPTSGPVLSIESDHRVAVDIDARGVAWARIARGSDESVEILIDVGERV